MTGPAARVTLVLHTFSRGGSDRVAAHLARGFTDRGLAVELVVFARGGEVETVLTDLLGDDIPVTYLGQGRGFRALDLVRGFAALVRHLRASRPDAVISTANNTALVTALAFRAARLGAAKLYLKTTNPIASSRHRGLVRWVRRASYRAIFRWVAGVWTLSADETREMAGAFPGHAALFTDVANPYVTAHMLAPPAQPRPPSPGRTVVTIARLTRQKRVERLIAAMAAIDRPDVHLLVLGEGEERGALEAMIGQLGLGGRVTLAGYVADVAPALHAADLFVLTSDYEGLPAAALEAMAANCPVLSTDCFPCARTLLAEGEGCGIIEDVAPWPLARLVLDRLDRPRPRDLHRLAERYSIENGVLSHLRAMAGAIGG